MVGNDIIDLRDADARPGSFRARFDERVFSVEERRAIAHDAYPLARRWAHWGAKEAAYKLAKQIDSAFVFSPGKLIAHFTPYVDYADYAGDASHTPVSRQIARPLERRGVLEFPHALPRQIRELELRSFETADRVHVVVVPTGTDWDSIEIAVDVLDRACDDPSITVRAMAIRGISRMLGIAEERITIGREGRIPIVERDGSRIPLSLSLSHHGRWISYAVRRRVDAQSQSVWTERSVDDAGRAAGAT